MTAASGRAPLVVHEAGDPAAPSVVLLHGLTDAGTVWPDLVERWGSRYRILAPDLRGHGRSPRFTDEELVDPHAVMVADVVALLDSLPGPVLLVGHSMGGNLALNATLARPERVRALVLEDPAKPPANATPDPEFVAWNEAMIDAVVADRAAEVARMARETPWSAAEIEAWAECKPFVDRRFLRRTVLGAADWEELFEALTRPTLLLVPVEAPMAPGPIANPLVTRLVVEEAGHCLRRDRPEEYHRAVEAFWAEVL